MMLRMALTLLLFLGPGLAGAQEVSFGEDWREQRFSLFSGNRFGLEGDRLSVRSEGTVSLLWRPLPESLGDAQKARWNWSVERSVPPTDLTVRGGDDRNLALYFLFLPESLAQDGRDLGVGALLDAPEVRVLMYVWGGAHARGDILSTPYLGERGRTIILRDAGTGRHTESIDLARDHVAAFGNAPERLVGIAISADSDDTEAAITAELGQLRID
jgi:hypothetical protein